MRVANRCLLMLLLALLMRAEAGAQLSNPPPFPGPGTETIPTRFAAGVSLIVSEPKEEFRRNVGNGVGVQGTLNYYLDRSGWVNLRFDPSWIRYGHETKRGPFSQTVGGRVEVDVTTTNQIVGLSFGPELTLPRGPVRPYLSAAFSGLLFRTTSSVRGTGSNNEEIAGSTNHSDWTGAWVLGAGLKVPLGGRASALALDLGLRYHDGSEASYLREGSIQDNPDGSITITPLVSETPFMMYSIGIHYRFPRSSADPCPGWLC